MKCTIFARLVALPLAILLLAASAWAKSMELTSANTYYGQGDMRQALEWYEKADQKDTREAQVYSRLVELYAEQQAWDKMNAAFAKIEGCRDKPKHLNRFREEARSIIDQAWMGLWNGSIRQFESAEEALSQGDSLAAIEAFGQARHRIEVALEIQPDKPELLKRLGDISISQYNAMHKGGTGFEILGQAAAPYARLVELHPDSLDYGLTLVQLLFNTRRLDEARRTVDTLLERHIDHPDLLNYAGKVRIQQGLELGGEEGHELMMNAVGYLQRAIDRNPGDPMLTYNLALLYRDMEDYASALRTFAAVESSAAERQDLLFDSWYSMALIYIQDLPEEQQDAAKAAEYFEKALGLQPDNAALKNNLGVALLRTGEPEAIERGKKLLGYE
jgi:tetratricopeptide (TPR) repeat protein